MHSNSFQDTELKLYRYVKDSPVQVVEGLTILCYPWGLRNKGLITKKKRKFKIHSQSFQDTEMKLQKYVSASSGQVVNGLTIL